MATQDDEAPALADRRYPWTDTDAEARISQYTAGDNSSVFGLANLLFRNYDQLCRALRDLGWHVDLPVYIEDKAGTTWTGTIKKGRVEHRMVVHSYQGEALIINVAPVKKDEPA